jgi:hypothetical protein
LFIELPTQTDSTPEQRLEALKAAKDLMAGSPETTTGGIFGNSTTKPRDYFDATEAIRIAEYITTGHDYRDTHPEGKRRPIIKTTNVTVVAPGMPDKEDLEHLISHIKDGSFEEFMQDLMKEAESQSEQAEDEKSADEGEAKPWS